MAAAVAVGAVVVIALLGQAALRSDAGARFLRRDATWAAMHDRGVFRVGMDPSFPPFEQLDAAGQPVGYDVDLASALAAGWGLQSEIVALGFDSLIDALRAAKVDAVISAMPYDERLTRDVAFSTAYFESGIRLAAPPDSPVRSVEDLGGKRVAVEWGSTGDMIARTLQREQGVDLEIAPYESPDAAMDAAASQTGVDAVIVDQVSLRLAQGRGVPLVAVGPVLESAPYVIITPRRAGILAQSVNDALGRLASDGALNRLEERWFGAAPLHIQPESP